MFRDVPFTNHAPTPGNTTISVYRAVYYNESSNVSVVYKNFWGGNTCSLRLVQLRACTHMHIILWVFV